MSTYFAGIDLGTTNTVCAVMTEGSDEPRVLKIWQPIDDFGPDGFGPEDLLPSVVHFEGEAVYVGVAARDARRLALGASLTSMKRRMGEHWESRNTDRIWTPTSLSACVLAAVRQQLESEFDRLPDTTVITVPASFGSEARRATRRAAWMAGFDPATIRLFDEPTAAILDELRRQPDLVAETGTTRCLVIDIGGGTLDVSLLKVGRDSGRLVVDVQGRSRFNELAGDDFDLRIAGLLLGRFEEERGTMETMAADDRNLLFVELLLNAEEVKKKLSVQLLGKGRAAWRETSEPLSISLLPQGYEPWQTRVSGEDLFTALKGFFDLEGSSAGRLDRYSFFRPVEQCIEAAQTATSEPMSPEDVDLVLLVGGSARLPIIAPAVRRICGSHTALVAEPLLAVAKGAALYAVQESDGSALRITDRMSDGVYVETEAGRFAELVPPHTRIPCEFSQDRALVMGAHDHRMEVNLFMGPGLNSGHLTPLAQRRIDFGEVLSAATPIAVQVDANESGEATFAFSAQGRQDQLTASVQVAAGASWEEDNQSPAPLPPVNPR